MRQAVAPTETDAGAGDADRQNQLTYWAPMLGAARPELLDPYGGLGSPGVSGIIFADVDDAPLYRIQPLDEDISPQPENWRFATKGTDTAAKKGDVKLAYDLSETDPSTYATLLDVDNVYPASQVWENQNWMPDVANVGALRREPRYPLPLPQNAAVLGATTEGEVQALKLRRVPRVWFFTWNQQAWQEYDVDGRHVIFPRQQFPIGDGPMVPQTYMQSVNAVVPLPITSELGEPASPGEDYSAYVGV